MNISKSPKQKFNNSNNFANNFFYPQSLKGNKKVIIDLNNGTNINGAKKHKKAITSMINFSPQINKENMFCEIDKKHEQQHT